MRGERGRWARLSFAVAFAAFAAGVAVSAAKYPEQPFDWAYIVMSSLASQKRNPEGGRWFAAAVGVSMLLLWPVVSYLRDAGAARARRWPIVALRVAVVCGLAVGVERLVFTHLSDLVYKGHEVFAVGMFAGLYAGVLGLYFQRLKQNRRALTGAVIVGAPLVAIGITQLALYLGQRHLGWVDIGWRAMGVPVWLSFAFWQWLAVAILWAGLGHLAWTAQRGGSIEPPGGAS